MNAAAAAELDSSAPIPDDAPRVRLMCSLGGRILPRPQDSQLRYVGGDTRIVAVHRSATFSTLHDKLSKLAPSSEVTIKYQLPNEDLDSLISVTGDDDVENMMEEHDRLVSSPAAVARTARLRLFIFPAGDAGPAGFGSMLDGSGSKRDSWFLDVLNGGTGRLERGRSDVSSLVSEVPDYLFGLDNNSEDSRPKLNASEPGSPVPATNSPKYSSTSSVVSPSVSKGYVPNPAVWHYAQEPVPVYYMPPPPVRPIPVQYFNHVQPAAGGPMYRPSPLQGVWSNPGHSVPVYSTYDYPVAGDGGGMLKGPVYPGTGVAPAPAGGDMAGAAAMGRAYQN